MIFKPNLAQKVLKGEKTQTRRIVKPGEFWDGKTVCRPDGAIKWQVGQSYAIQPGRTKAAIGRFKLLDIRRERVQDISEGDAIAEGFSSISEFFGVFESINGKAALDKEVWVLVFEVINPAQ